MAKVQGYEQGDRVMATLAPDNRLQGEPAEDTGRVIKVGVSQVFVRLRCQIKADGEQASPRGFYPWELKKLPQLRKTARR